jgi:undecaprenyl-diphosphatase
MSLPLVLLLAVVQGITEFLPISSDGHLVVVARLYEQFSGENLPNLLSVNIMLHAGTLGSIVAYYWPRLWRMLSQDRRVLGLVFVGTLPAVLIGLPLHEYGKSILENALLAGCMLIATGLILIAASRCRPGTIDYPQMTYTQAFWIGCAQAFAILPGASRSGSTISAGMALGLRRDAAANFSFLMAVPAIGGAVALDLFDVIRSGDLGASVGALVAGAVVAFFVGLVALGWLLRWLAAGRFQWFAWWVIPLGAAVIAWQLA